MIGETSDRKGLSLTDLLAAHPISDDGSAGASSAAAGLQKNPPKRTNKGRGEQH
jgi:hypothetical protein